MTARIVLLENDPDVGMITEDALRAEGFDVHLVTRVADAIASCRARVPDVVLVDLLLDGESGWDFVRWARDEGVRARIAAFSVHANESERVTEGAELGVDVLVEKSGDHTSLMRALRALLARPLAG